MAARTKDADMTRVNNAPGKAYLFMVNLAAQAWYNNNYQRYE